MNSFKNGDPVGPYILLRELGRGGMGEVWLAERSDGAPSRRVALKLPHAHLTVALRHRFVRERDIQAALSHPHIAMLYDAGITDRGHLYLAMEWIDGVSISQFCRDARLAVAARLALFDQVLDAVRYAHERFIAHRDLKPANILVTREGQVKLLDFGLAKLLRGETGGAPTELTELGDRAATTDYAAPEQIAGGSVTTAVDLYAAGVVLFELLTGSRPFDRPGETADSRDAPLASLRVTEVEAQFVGGLNRAQLRKVLRDDLDAILAKTLETDPARRYRSAQAFADDLLHHRRHELISARRAIRLAQVGKFIRRNVLASAVAASLLLVLILGSAGIAWEAIGAEREAARAGAEARRADADVRREKMTKEFLVSMFNVNGQQIPSDKRRGSITAKELLDVSADRIQRRFAADPDVAIELLGIAADVYNQFDENDASMRLLRQQLALSRTRYGQLNPIYIDGLLRLVDAQNNEEHFTDSQKLLSEIDGIITRAGLDHASERAWWWWDRSQTLLGDVRSRPEGIAALQNAITLYAAVAPADPSYAEPLQALSRARYHDGDLEDAIKYLQLAIAVGEKSDTRSDAAMAPLHSDLGALMAHSGRFAEAERSFGTAVDLARKAFGTGDRDYWIAESHYARLICLNGDRRRALQLFEALMPSLPAESDESQPRAVRKYAALARLEYGSCLVADGQPRAGVSLLQSAERDIAALSDDTSSLVRARGSLAHGFDGLGQATKARRLLRTALDTSPSATPADRVTILWLEELRGAFLLKHGDIPAAESAFEGILDHAPESTLESVARAYGGLARVALARRDKARADDLSQRAVETFSNVTGLRDIRTGPYLWGIRARALILSGDGKSAANWARRALDADRLYHDPSSLEISEAEAALTAARTAAAVDSSR